MGREDMFAWTLYSNVPQPCPVPDLVDAPKTSFVILFLTHLATKAFCHRFHLIQIEDDVIGVPLEWHFLLFFGHKMYNETKLTTIPITVRSCRVFFVANSLR